MKERKVEFEIKVKIVGKKKRYIKYINYEYMVIRKYYIKILMW